MTVREGTNSLTTLHVNLSSVWRQANGTPQSATVNVCIHKLKKSKPNFFRDLTTLKYDYDLSLHFSFIKSDNIIIFPSNLNKKNPNQTVSFRPKTTFFLCIHYWSTMNTHHSFSSLLFDINNKIINQNSYYLITITCAKSIIYIS